MSKQGYSVARTALRRLSSSTWINPKLQQEKTHKCSLDVSIWASPGPEGKGKGIGNVFCMLHASLIPAQVLQHTYTCRNYVDVA